MSSKQPLAAKSKPVPSQSNAAGKKPQRKRQPNTSQKLAKIRDNHARTKPSFGSAQLRLAQQIIAPASISGEVLPTPLVHSEPVVPRIYHRIIDYVVPASGKFTAVMSPDLFVPGSITNDSIKLIPTGGPGELVFQGGAAIVNPGPAGMVDIRGTFSTATEKLITKTHDITFAGVTKRGLTVSTTGGGRFVITNKNQTKQFSCNIWYVQGGVWTDTGAVICAANSQMNFNIGANGGAIALTHNGAVTVEDVQVSWSFLTAQYTADPTVMTSFSPAFADAISKYNITQGRVLALTMKITNTSNALSKGGNISIGRVPSGFNAFADISQEMSKLPANRRYQGPAETGGFTFWMPAQDDEWSLDEIPKKAQSYAQANFILAHLNGLPVGSSFRITFAWLVEFYTAEESFNKIQTPPITEQWSALVALMSAMDSSCCNPESQGAFDRFVANTRAYVKGAKDHYERNADTYQMLMSFGAQLAQMLAAA